MVVLSLRTNATDAIFLPWILPSQGEAVLVHSLSMKSRESLARDEIDTSATHATLFMTSQNGGAHGRFFSFSTLSLISFLTSQSINRLRNSYVYFFKPHFDRTGASTLGVPFQDCE